MTYSVSFTIEANDPYEEKMIALVNQIREAGGTIAAVQGRPQPQPGQVATSALRASIPQQQPRS